MTTRVLHAWPQPTPKWQPSIPLPRLPPGLPQHNFAPLPPLPLKDFHPASTIHDEVKEGGMTFEVPTRFMADEATSPPTSSFCDLEIADLMSADPLNDCFEADSSKIYAYQSAEPSSSSFCDLEVADLMSADPLNDCFEADSSKIYAYQSAEPSPSSSAVPTPNISPLAVHTLALAAMEAPAILKRRSRRRRPRKRTRKANAMSGGFWPRSQARDNIWPQKLLIKISF